ncbi:uncharacterized protein LOC125651791 isoform X2 [Ostrea edulis]|uniref:uncharacterized protein LOC125651791 isoform X2 n=1 Tax=Ostrea edulis TaxID=37623 RepID=UPI0024AF7CB8|nr:uncharacterized protein LOC125651791 isoform X2 [Ostrea edulis]XP_056022437.1 uncharacterized protein LOC125651791 isoform X2 [Ostrea edulis]
MSGLPGGGPPLGNNFNSLLNDNPMDIFGQGGDQQGLAALLQNGGGDGIQNLQAFLNEQGGVGQGQGHQMFNPAMAGGQGDFAGMNGMGQNIFNPAMLQGQGQGHQMFNPAMAGGQGDFSGMMGMGQNVFDPAMLQGQGFDGGGIGGVSGGGTDPNVLSNLQGMSEEDRKAVLAAMQGDGAIPQTVDNSTSGAGGTRRMFGGHRFRENPGRRPGIYQNPTENFGQEIQQEAEKATACTDSCGTGTNTIIILDTSDSMRGDGITQAKEAIQNLMSELEGVSMDHGLEENLCVITCGNDTCVVQHLTNDYQLIRQSLDRVHTQGSTPLQRAIALSQGALRRAQQPVMEGSQALHARIIIFSDGFVTNSSNTQGSDSVSEETSKQETPGVLSTMQSMIAANGVRFIYVPVGRPDNTFSAQVEVMWGARIVLAGDVKSLAKYQMHQRVAAMVKENKKEGPVTKEMVQAVAQSKYPSLGERDFEAIMVLIDESNRRGGGLDLNDLAQLGMPSGPGTGTPIRPSTNPLLGGGIAGLQQGFSGLNLGAGIRPPGTRPQAPASSPFNPLQGRANGSSNFSFPGVSQVGEGKNGRHFSDEDFADTQRQIQERREEIQRMRERGEWPPKDTDTMPFQLPGLMARPDRSEDPADESEEITQEKINELLKKYGGGPPKKDNLPLPLNPGIRVTTGPNWMWRMNGVEINEEGKVVESKPDEEENPSGEFDGWIRVRWDNGIEEDYRYGLDYEFDIEPLKGGMDAVEWPPGKERIIIEEKPLVNDEEDFLETMRNLINTDGDPSQSSSSTTDNLNSLLRTPTLGSHGPPPQPGEIPFLNPIHAEEYERLIQNQQSNPQNLSASQLPNQFDGPHFPPDNPQTFSSTGVQSPPIPGQTSSNVTHSNQNAGGQNPVETTVQTVTVTTATASVTSVVTPASSTVSTTRNSTADNEVCYVWQYLTVEGNWKSYPPDIQRKAETEYLKRKNKGSIVINMGKGSERIVFKSMEQRNIEKNQILPVRRIEADAEKLRELQEMWSSS